MTDDPDVRYVVEVHLDEKGDRRDQVVFSNGTSFISGWGGYQPVNHTWEGGSELKLIAAPAAAVVRRKLRRSSEPLIVEASQKCAIDSRPSFPNRSKPDIMWHNPQPGN